MAECCTPVRCGPGYASPAEAMKAPRELLLYTVALYIGTGIQKPDYLATIDADPNSPTYSQVISRLEMPGIGDELHHMGWNACSSCHGDPTRERRYLIVPTANGVFNLTSLLKLRCFLGVAKSASRSPYIPERK